MEGAASPWRTDYVPSTMVGRRVLNIVTRNWRIMLKDHLSSLSWVHTLTLRQMKIILQFHERSCFTCRYFRMITHKGGATATECLLLGRTLGIQATGTAHLIGWARERYCDGWKKRPKTWNYVSTKNPHWFDQYLKRETLIRIRKQMGTLNLRGVMNWKRWFAWFPVRTEEGTWVWLKNIERAQAQAWQGDCATFYRHVVGGICEEDAPDRDWPPEV